MCLPCNALLATQRGSGEYRGWWEFPGGKVESGESPAQALVREIQEELDMEIVVGDFFITVEDAYPEFHLVMDCFWCTMQGTAFTLLEHAAAQWLPFGDLRQVQWLPADLAVIDALEKMPPCPCGLSWVPRR